MNTSRLRFLAAIVLLVGCAKATGVATQSTSTDTAPDVVTYDAKWNNRNADIYRYLLAELDKPIPARIYFITTTPMAQWGEGGKWETIPADEMNSFPNTAGYRPANEAHFKDGHVLENGTDAKAWMQWISVKRWISETEVEVEEGVWCCPLGGGASTTIYERIDGKWHVKERGDSWVS